MKALELHYLVKEMQFLVNGKINQIYVYGKKDVMLEMHVPLKGKFLVKLVAPDRFFVSSVKPEAVAPNGFAMFLRKRLANARLRSFSQVGFERVVEFVFTTKDSSFRLIAEFFSKGNIVLCDPDYNILSVAENQMWKDKAVKAKEKYVMPHKDYNFLKMDENGFASMLKESNKQSLVKSLALDLGLGGMYAEEACLLAKVDKDVAPGSFKSVTKLWDVLSSMRKMKIKAMVYGKEIVPFELKSLADGKEYDSISSAIEDNIVVESAAMSKHKQEVERLKHVIEAQKKKIMQMEKQEVDAAAKGDLIYAKYQVVEEVLKEINKAAKTMEWKEIKAKLKGHKIVKELNTKDKQVVVEL